jgi:hypothetical protein
MALSSLQNVQVGASLIEGKVGTGGVLGSQGSIPTIPALQFSLGDAALKLSIIAHVGSVPGGTLVNAAAAPVAINLTTLTDLAGATVAAARIKGLLILNLGTTDGQDLQVDFTVTNGIRTFTGAAAGKVTVKAGTLSGSIRIPGFVMFACPSVTGYVVTAATAMMLAIDPGANTIPYAVFVLGNLT